MKLAKKLISVIAITASLGAVSSQAIASDYKKDPCAGLPSYYELVKALRASVAPNVKTNGGFDLNMWGTVVNRDGVVCAVAFTGKKRGDQWPGSRVISAQKANTANAFSLDGVALATANLYSAVQPGGSLFGLQFSNPVDPSVAYGLDGSPKVIEGKSAKLYGTKNDPLVGDIVGGVNVFGGGLPLYNKYGKIIGGVGVSGDTSCADHNIAWRLRQNIKLDNVPDDAFTAGPNGTDGIGYLKVGEAPFGFNHPQCGLNGLAVSQEIGAGDLRADP